MSLSELKYKTNTARAILGAAGLFKYAHQVVWEYVSNELQYRDKSIKAKIFVKLEKDKMQISGNGSGMNYKDLENFFTLHGENLERKKGNPGRGLKGTGKSAAYGIANSFLISTVKNKKQIVIKLTKNEINKYKASGQPIPLKKYILEDEIKTKEPNGTIIEITELKNKIDRKEVINYIEKFITYWKGAEVYVDNYLCVPKEPQFKKEYKFNSSKDYPELGNIDLVIKIASEPLEQHEQGIRILSNQNLHEMTLCGADGKEMSNYIFGEIDCPKLDDDDQEIEAISMARDMTLNPGNSTVKSIYSFIGTHVEEIRKQLVKENNELRESEEAKKLQKQADKIAEKINEHFQNYKDKIKMKHKRLSDGKTGVAISTNSGKSDINGSLTVGDELNALMEHEENIFQSLNKTNKNDNENDKERKKTNLKEDKNESKKAKKVNGGGNNKSSGGTKFKVSFKEHGKKNKRAKFVNEENTVYINLDCPYISKLKKDENIKDITKNTLFNKIAYEIAFTEYAFALTNLLHQKRYFRENTDEYLQEARQIVNDLSIPTEYIL